MNALPALPMIRPTRRALKSKQKHKLAISIDDLYLFKMFVLSFKFRIQLFLLYKDAFILPFSYRVKHQPNTFMTLM